MRFEFATAGRIVFGAGSVGQVGPIAAELAGTERRALVVSGKSLDRVRPVIEALELEDFECALLRVEQEPSIELVEAGLALAREHEARLVIGIGGGSAVDAGKAIAALLTNPGDVRDYLEVIGRSQPLLAAPLPYIAVPTTAGTGAEVTRNAVLASAEHAVKVSLRSPLMLPRVALIDPELTYGLPPEVTSSTGLDALTQLIEPFVSVRANPLTDALCREGIARAARSLPRAFADGGDAAAREDMCIASLFGGMALANAGLGAVHGFAGPIGGMFPAPHGAVCAALLPHVMALNVRALRQRDPGAAALQRYAEIAALATGSRDASAADAASWARQLCATLGIPPLRTYGLSEADFGAIIPKAEAASSMKGNPVALTQQELEEILSGAL